MKKIKSEKLYKGIYRDNREAADNSAGKLWDTFRLKQLRKMLSFADAPLSSQTEYMNLQEFRDRKVLPLPEKVN